MTHPALIERITRSLAYMLRHQPEQFDLELDEFGWADLREVVRALNERLGEPVAAEEVQDAVGSGDRQRYEIDRGMIRALYGHSIDVQPGEPSQPPELLFVGVSRQDAERAERFGLRPGRRRFLHLALTAEDALESAARSAEDAVLVKVHSMDAWEEGINFYDRKSLFLSDPIPTHYLEISEAPEREQAYAGAHAGESEVESEGAAESEAGPAGEPAAPREFAPRAPGEGGGRRRRGRRGGRGRGRDFGDERRPPLDAPPAERAPAYSDRPDRGAPPPSYDDRPRQGYGREERPRHAGAGHAPHGSHGPQGGHGSHGGHGAPGGHRESGGGRGERGGRGGYRDERPRPSHDDRPPRQDRPRFDDRPHAGERERDIPRRDERPREDRPREDRPREERPREERPRPAAQGHEFGAGMSERRPAPPPPPPPAPRVEPPKPAPKPARRDSGGDDAFGAGL